MNILVINTNIQIHNTQKNEGCHVKVTCCGTLESPFILEATRTPSHFLITLRKHYALLKWIMIYQGLQEKNTHTLVRTHTHHHHHRHSLGASMTDS